MQASKRARVPALSLWSFKSAQVMRAVSITTTDACCDRGTLFLFLDDVVLIDRVGSSIMASEELYQYTALPQQTRATLGVLYLFSDTVILTGRVGSSTIASEELPYQYIALPQQTRAAMGVLYLFFRQRISY